MTTGVENPRTFFRHELRLQSVFHKLAWASSAGIISLLFIFVAYSQAWKTRPPVRLAGSQQWKLAACAVPPAAGDGDPLLQTQNPMMSRIASDLRQRHVQP